MNYLKNINKIVFFLLVVVNLSVNFNYVVSQKSSSSNSDIELIVSKQISENDTINFKQFFKFYSNDELLNQITEKVFICEYRIKKDNILEQLNFKNQLNTFFDFKPLLLQIDINDILVQKSYWI